jgi:hypothetical protein
VAARLAASQEGLSSVSKYVKYLYGITIENILYFNKIIIFCYVKYYGAFSYLYLVSVS